MVCYGIFWSGQLYCVMGLSCITSFGDHTYLQHHKTTHRLQTVLLLPFHKTFIRKGAFNSKKVLSNNARNRMTNAK